MCNPESQISAGTLTRSFGPEPRKSLSKVHLSATVPNRGTKINHPYEPAPQNRAIENACHVFHSRVQCDGCGMNPIEGSRYKSKRVPDYDLCFSCFERMGTITDFKKLDQPEFSPQRGNRRSLFLRRDLDFQSFSNKAKRITSTALRPLYAPECPFSGQLLDNDSINVNHGKFDARFVKDITVSDGTELEPGTKFTKSWLMQNNGSLSWPVGTQLVHVGGPALSISKAITLELPVGGLASGQDYLISIDLIASLVVGYYTSYWRLQSPSGQCFGHEVWVAINVITPLAEVKQEIPCKGEASFESETMDVGAVVIDSLSLSKEEELSATLGAEKGVGRDDHLDSVASVRELCKHEQFPKMEKASNEVCFGSQMSSLMAMGFEDSELCMFWLKKNSGNVDMTVKDLIRCAGWEDKIRHLEEMGFKDERANLSLLNRKKGSIKLVVKDLVKLENQAKAK
ncbi:hypothetical protein KP509_01G063100 [Ceratopteris richardii]|nr:hypothetical protein KP509_01G063100 [Ceratopteris richardii]